MSFGGGGNANKTHQIGVQWAEIEKKRVSWVVKSDEGEGATRVRATKGMKVKAESCEEGSYRWWGERITVVEAVWYGDHDRRRWCDRRTATEVTLVDGDGDDFRLEEGPRHYRR